MEILKIAVLALCAGTLALIVRQKQPELSRQVALACGLIILVYTVNYLGSVISFFNETVNKFSLPIVSITVVLKIIGVAYLCEFTAQSLKDMSETSLAQKVELAGRVVIVMLTIPMFNAFLQLLTELAKGVNQ